jgi:hypothetical protein
MVQILNQKSGSDYFAHFRTNNLCHPASTRIHVAGDYFIIVSTIGSKVYSFICDRVSGKSFLINVRGSICQIAPSLHLISSDGNALFSAITASEVVNKRKICDGRAVEDTSPFRISGLSRFESIDPDDNAILVLFELRDDLNFWQVDR